LNQQPFAVEPFFDRCNFFSFHTYRLTGIVTRKLKAVKIKRTPERQNENLA
jgi:hypothetical protein